MSTTQKSLCVFCGSRDGVDPAYAAAAEEVGRSLAQAGVRLVYGAGDVGLMGRVARSAEDAGGDIMGIIPTHLMALEVGRTDLGQTVITETMHERKKVMFMNSDAVAVLPGGAGSLDEFFEVLTWAQLGLHEKPIYLLNINGYWAPLLAMMDHVISQGFADASVMKFVTVVGDLAEFKALLNKM